MRFSEVITSGFGHAAGLDTTGTDPNPPCLAVLNTSHTLEIRIPPSLIFVMGMTYIIADNWSFAANFTYFGHFRVSF